MLTQPTRQERDWCESGLKLALLEQNQHTETREHDCIELLTPELEPSPVGALSRTVDELWAGWSTVGGGRGSTTGVWWVRRR